MANVPIYLEQGGKKLVFGSGSVIEGLPVATTEAAGVVKQAAAVADAASTPTKAEFNALLAALRAAGIIAPNAEK
jgi:hypothetical protein